MLKHVETGNIQILSDTFGYFRQLMAEVYRYVCWPAACRSCRTGTRSRYRFVDTEVWGCATKSLKYR